MRPSAPAPRWRGPMGPGSRLLGFLGRLPSGTTAGPPRQGEPLKHGPAAGRWDPRRPRKPRLPAPTAPPLRHRLVPVSLPPDRPLPALPGAAPCPCPDIPQHVLSISGAHGTFPGVFTVPTQPQRPDQACVLAPGGPTPALGLLRQNLHVVLLPQPAPRACARSGASRELILWVLTLGLQPQSQTISSVTRSGTTEASSSRLLQ